MATMAADSTAIDILQEWERQTQEATATGTCNCQGANGFKCNLYLLSYIPYKCWTTYDMPVSEVLQGTKPWLEELLHQKRAREIANGYPRGGNGQTASGLDYRTSWIHLPLNNLKWIEDAARIIYGQQNASSLLQAVLGWIRYLEEKESLSRPGVYVPYDSDLLPSLPTLPILDFNTRAPIHCRYGCKEYGDMQQHRRQCIQQMTKIVAEQRQNEEKDHRWTNEVRQKLSNMSRVVGCPDEKVLHLEHTLDEYCHQSLRQNFDLLDSRDQDQVLSRNIHRNRPRTNSLEEESEKYDKPESAIRRHACEDSQPKNQDPILVVSQLCVWRFGDFVITTYSDGPSFASPNIQLLRQRISTRFRMGINPMGDTVGDAARALELVILEECVKQEPMIIDSNRKIPIRLLDGAGYFASEIDAESQEVTASFEKYKKTLGKVDATYKDSVKQETDILLRLDDIRSELAMITRVKEDARLVAMDVYSESQDYRTVDSWMDRGRSKLKRLEDDASRVRQSLVTLLSLKQREVNAESLINSELQSQILFVFTATTVLFTPLSWVSGLLGLDIKGFTPEDSKWSIEAAAVSSSVTVASFTALMLFCLLAWRRKSVVEFIKKPKRDSDIPKSTDTSRLPRNLKAKLFHRRQPNVTKPPV